MPLPPGYTLDVGPKLPAGYTVDPSAPPDSGSSDAPSVTGFLQNAVSSGANLLGGVATAIVHPINTLNNLGNVVGGLGNEYIPGAEANKRRMGASDEEIAQQNTMADALKQQIGNRYGTVHGFANAVYTDPVGVLADLSTLAGGIGGVAGKTAELADMANAASLAAKAGQVARVAGTVSAVTDPLNAITKPLGAAARVTGVDQALPALARATYQSALKPSRANTLENIDAMVQAGLDHQIPVSRSGLAKLNGLVKGWAGQLDSKVQAATQAGATIDPAAVAARVDPVEQFFGNQPNPVKDVTAVQKARQEFLDQHTTPGTPAAAPAPVLAANGQPLLDASGRPVMSAGTAATPPTVNPIPLDQAQAIKQNGGQILGQQYGELGTATIEARKALVRGIKEEIESQFPEIGTLNSKLAPALDLEPAIEEALKRGGNKDLIDLATKMEPGIGALTKVLGSAEFKSRLAFALQNAYKANPKLAAFGVPTYRVLANRVDQYANGLAAASGQTQ